MGWSTEDYSNVYTAVVLADEGPGRRARSLMDARWASRDEARDHIERRFPGIHDNPKYAGMRLGAFVVRGRTSCTMEPDDTGRVRPAERIQQDWWCKEQAVFQSDGKVTGWI